jgi:phosphate transport system substrate-binding protein
MRRGSSILLVALVFIMAFNVVACGGAATPTSTVPAPTATQAAVAPTKAPGAPTAPAPTAVAVAATATPKLTGAPALINGAGATFPYPLYSRWFYEYAFVDPTAKFNYQSIGSGGGIQQITAKTVDFGASDAILTAAQYTAAPGIQMLPIVAGAVVPIYFTKEVTQGLTLESSVLGDIFLGKITKWNDPAIKKSNPNLALPNKDIIVVHRSDSSGTSFIFTDYLSASNKAWQDTVGVGSAVKWPVGLGGKGNEGVAGTVQQNDGAIGYVELAYAKQNKLAFAAVQNKAGTFVAADLSTTQNAMSDFGGDMPASLARSIVDAAGKNSWPIAGYTYLLVYTDMQDCAKASRIVNFIRWGLSDGAKYATELDYVALPDGVRAQVLQKLGTLTCQGKPIS